MKTFKQFLIEHPAGQHRITFKEFMVGHKDAIWEEIKGNVKLVNLLTRMLSGQKLNHVDSRFLEIQIKDTIKTLSLGIIVILPAGSIALAVASYFKLDLLPSSIRRNMERNREKIRLNKAEKWVHKPGRLDKFKDPRDDYYRKF